MTPAAPSHHLANPYTRPNTRSNRDTFRPFVKKVQELTASADNDLTYSPTELEDILVHQLNQADQRACLFCGEPHLFENCKAFTDKKYVENFLIKIVSTVKGKLREATRLQQGLPPAHTSKSQDTRIHQVIQDTVDHLLHPQIHALTHDVPPSTKPTTNTDATTQPPLGPTSVDFH